MVRNATTSAERRAAAIERILAGKSTEEREARKLGVSVSAVRGFVTRERNRAAPAPIDAGAREPIATAQPSSAETERAGVEPPELETDELEPEDAGGLEAALGGAFEDEHPPAAAAAPAALPPLSLSPEQVVELAATMKHLALTSVAGKTLGQVPDQVRRQVLGFTPQEREQLLACAPYAAPYLEKLLGNDPRFLALGFVAIWGFSVWGSMRALRDIAKAMQARPVREEQEEHADAAAAASPA